MARFGASYQQAQARKVYMNALQRLAETFAELAENGNDSDLENALELCLGYRITHNRSDDGGSLTELRVPGATERNSVRRLN